MTGAARTVAWAQAWADAERAARAARVVVREVASVAELSAVRRVFDTVWDADPTNPAATVELLRAYAHTGQYVVLAEDAEATHPFPRNVVAASVGFLAAPVGRALHSNITGVLPSGLGRSLGYAVKLHQRAWALERGLDLVTWTFDPLIRRNAWFNLAKLGADPVEYLEDFYGPMGDGLNAGDASDRLYLHWRLDGPAAADGAAGRFRVADVDALRRNGSRVVLAVADDGRRPVIRPVPDGVAALLVQVPEDVERLRGTDPEVAAAWRAALRETLGGSMRAGWRVTGVGRDGWYVLQRSMVKEPT